jgi:hypothetical protein
MSQNDKNQGNDARNKGKGNRAQFDKDQPSEVAGQPIHRPSKADDKGQGLRRKPESRESEVAELDEPKVEGVGNDQGKHTEATMPTGQGTDPKRNTM